MSAGKSLDKVCVAKLEAQNSESKIVGTRLGEPQAPCEPAAKVGAVQLTRTQFPIPHLLAL